MAISSAIEGKCEIMPYYVYMLTNRYRNVLYTGMTNDLIRRVYKHRNHLVKDSFTARYNVTRLVYFEMTEDVRSAIEREKQIKSWPRARKDALVETQSPTWEDQYTMILGE